MADRLKGITLEIGGDTTKLSKALSGVNSDIINTKSALKDVERLLKLDPTNVDLLRQREKLLTDEVKATTEKLDKLKEAQQTMDATGVDKNCAQYMALQREIIATEQELGNLEQASDKANATLSKISATADKVSTGAGKVASATKGLSTAAAGALAGIGGMAYSAVTSADDLNTLAKQSGFTTAELQKMQYASDLIDVSMDDITSSAQKLKKNMGSSSGSIGEAFAKLGVNVRDANGSMRDSTDVYWDVITALGKVGNETERDQLAMTLLGKGADSLAGIIDDGGAAFRALGKEAEDAGLILSQDTLDSLNAVNDKIDETKAKTQATLATAGAKAMEALTPVLDEIIGIIGKALEAIGSLDEGQIKMILTVLAVVAAISPVASIVSGIASVISVLAGTVLPALSGAMTVLNAVMAANPILLIVAAVAAVIVALVVLYNKCEWFRDGVNAIFGAIKDFFVSVWEGICGFFTETIPAAWDSVVGFFQGIPEWWNGLWQSVSDTVSQIWDTVSNTVLEKSGTMRENLQAVDDFMQGVFAKDWTETFGPVLGGVLNNFFDNVEGIWNGVKESMDGVIDVIEGVFSGDWEKAWEGIKDIFGGIFDALFEYAKIPLNGITDFLNGIIDGANWCIDKLNQIPGVNFDTIGNLPFFANGGTLTRGSAVVGDAGPEILTVSGGKATVTPLTATVDGRSLAQAIGSQEYRTNVQVSFTGSLSQLATVLQPAIVAETERIGGSFTR